MLDDTTSNAYNCGMAKRQTHKLSDQMRQAIEDSGLSRYAIAKETGIDQAALSRFIHGQMGLSLDALDRLGEFLQLTIILGRKPNSKG